VRESELLPSLHDEHASPLLRYVGWLTRGRAGAQDTVQETSLRAWRNKAVLEQTGGSAGPWLRTVVRHVAIDQWRSAGRGREILTDHAPDLTVEDTSQQTLDRQLVLAAMRTLTVEHREALVETYYRGASVAEAAKRLGVPAGTVRSRTYYALRALRRAIDAMGGVA
jgi:RNA polymerase sigma-70 factor (ECF subfamily)